MRVEYDVSTRELRLVADDPQREYDVCHENIAHLELDGKAWFFWVKKDVEDQLGLLHAEPTSPHQVQEIAFILRELRKTYPVVVADTPGFTNPRLYPRAEWLAALRHLDKELAQKVRAYTDSEEGHAEYLAARAGNGNGGGGNRTSN